jgi:hypothetical protein|tara:strand:- start:474 stop:1157 length:684 start_codon:yes stop_codon:yes gene_type:complete
VIKYETTKLFYDKYLYKLGITNPLGFIFRNKNLSHARSIIDKLHLNQESGEPIRYKLSADSHRTPIDLTVEDVHDLKYLLTEFREEKDFVVRCEQRSVGIFSNNEEWLKRIGKKLDCVCDFYTPEDSTINLLLDNKNILIKNKPFKFKYKVTLGQGSVDRNFYDWAKMNPDKVRVSPGLLKRIHETGYVSGKYLYLRDEKVFTLAMLFLSANISRVDRIVLKQDVDK